MYAWYSLNAYSNGDTEYTCVNEYEQITPCTLITKTRCIPIEYIKNYKDVILCGTVTDRGLGSMMVSRIANSGSIYQVNCSRF